MSVERSKTAAGWRTPSLNQACLKVLQDLRSRADTVGFADPDHYVFPCHGRDKKIDPTRPMTSWRSAWRSIRKTAGLPRLRFHDSRHTALTRLAEKAQPDWVIQAQMGHVSPAMMKTYSHIRREALDEAADSLEPPFDFPASDTDAGDPARDSGGPVTSQFTSQSGVLDHEASQLLKESGSSGWTRTSNPPVNSRMLCH